MRRSRFRRYGVAVACAVAAYLLGRLVANPLQAPFGWFIPAVALSAWFGGLGPGLLTSLLSLLGGVQVMAELGVPASFEARLVKVVFTLLGGLVISGVIASLRRAHARATAEAAARAKAEHRVRRVLESVTDLYIRFAADWHIVEINQKFADTLGIGDEIVGLSMWERFPETVGNEFYTALHRVAAERMSVHFEAASRIVPGLWFEVHAYPEPDGGVSAYLRDITKRKRSEQALRAGEARWRTMAELVPSFVWMARPDGSIDFVNEPWYQFTGTPRTLALDDDVWFDVVHPEDRERCVRTWHESIARGAAYEIEARHRRTDGEYRWWLVRATPLMDAGGRIASWFGASTDIHDLKQLQQALREGDRRKDEFLAILAHELRNPLGPIRGAARLLREAPEGADLARAREVIDRQVDHLARLIEDLVDVSRITTNRLELRRSTATLAEIVENAVEISRPAIDAGRHELTIALPDEPLVLEADVVRLSQVFMNLLTNAAKYTQAGGRIRLSAERDDHYVVVRVEDNGVGIAPETLPRLFEMFFQVESVLDRTQSGLGIGLALVRHVVVLHGGSVTAHSDGVGRGTSIRVRLPLSLDRVRTPAGAPRRLPALGPRRVLVVDDNDDAVATLAMLLRHAGAVPHMARDGTSALALADAVQPEIVLLDIGLPGMNGYDVAAAIRQRSWGANVLIIALTGWGQPEDRERSRVAGFNHHLVKPVDPDGLLRLIVEQFQPAPA